MMHTYVYIRTTTQLFTSGYTYRYIRETYIHTIRINMYIPLSSAHAYNYAQIYTVSTVSATHSEDRGRGFAALHVTSAHRTLTVKQVQDLGSAYN